MSTDSRFRRRLLVSRVHLDGDRTHQLDVDASAPDGESVCIQYGSGRGCKYWYINSLGTNGKWTTRPVHFCRIFSCKQASDARPNRLQLSFEVCLRKLILLAASHAYVSRDRLQLASHQGVGHSPPGSTSALHLVGVATSMTGVP